MPRWLVLLIVAAAPLSAQRPLNLDFEMAGVGMPDHPWGWSLGWSAFALGGPATYTLDRAVRMQGAQSLRIVSRDTSGAAPNRAMQLQVPAEFARGRTLRLRGSMRSGGLTGVAQLQLEAWGDRVVPAADTATLDARSDTATWVPFDLRIRVPDESTIHSIVFMAGVQGAGTAWFDGLQLTVDGRPVTALPAGAPAITPAQRARLAARSTPLFTVDPTDVRRAPDLALVDRIIGNARVVGLGESTHGTREFFLAKHRLLRHLVEHDGFTLFAIEANQRAVERINAFVTTGEGAASDVIRTMFRVWNTEEMLALLEWLRAHNATARTKVRFVGYDMQDHALPRDSLVAFLHRTEPALVADVERLTSEYRAQPGYATPQVDEGARTAWSRNADSVQRLVASRRTAWLSSATTEADSIIVERAVHDATLLAQAARLNATLNSPDRDSLMAANLDWALRTLYPTDRVVVWAHDVHVSHGGDPQRSFNGGAQMGAHVKRSYGHQYRAFSLLTAHGTYSGTRSLSNHEVIPARAFDAPPGSVEAMLASVPRPPRSIGVVVDLRNVDAARDAWLHTRRPLRHIGYAAYDYGFDLEADMPLEFDGIVFIDTTTASRMLPGRRSSR